ncbi:hypothetical protein BDA99DRAFT_573581 [Phascolomyces articulosus]|uniref:Uncharacterized protein n=1 Tax=Phascolomyces articulosus TaxID=60185 RepID=A0AAD5PBX7_9FUNG|nr:hypothetical protein BDA99DRAFT_573581 [Phascolomyces articulosus]
MLKSQKVEFLPSNILLWRFKYISNQNVTKTHYLSSSFTLPCRSQSSLLIIANALKKKKKGVGKKEYSKRSKCSLYMCIDQYAKGYFSIVGRNTHVRGNNPLVKSQVDSDVYLGWALCSVLSPSLISASTFAMKQRTDVQGWRRRYKNYATLPSAIMSKPIVELTHEAFNNSNYVTVLEMVINGVSALDLHSEKDSSLTITQLNDLKRHPKHCLQPSVDFFFACLPEEILPHVFSSFSSKQLAAAALVLPACDLVVIPHIGEYVKDLEFRNISEIIQNLYIDEETEPEQKKMDYTITEYTMGRR